MGLLYTASARNLSLTANSNTTQDLFELVNGAGAALKIHWVKYSSQYNVDERPDLAFVVRSSTGSGGSAAITPQPNNLQNTIASKITSFKTLVTTVGALVGTYEGDQWSQLAPGEWVWTPETRFEIPCSGSGNPYRWCLNNANTFVAATRIINLWVKWEEN